MSPFVSSKKTYSPFAVHDELSYSDGMEEEQRKSILDKKIGDFVRSEIHRTGSFPAPFSDSVGIDRAQFRRLLNGTARWNTWHMEVVAEKLGIPVSDLFSESSTFRKHNQPPSLHISETQAVKRYEDTNKLSKENYIPIPLCGGKAAAGPPAEIREDEIESWVLIYASNQWMPNPQECYSCCEVYGWSMSPILEPGDIVAVDHAIRSPDQLDGKMTVFRINGGVTIKWLKWDKERGIVVGIPENREEKEHLVTLKGDEIDESIVGKVAWWWAKR